MFDFLTHIDGKTDVFEKRNKHKDELDLKITNVFVSFCFTGMEIENKKKLIAEMRFLSQQQTRQIRKRYGFEPMDDVIPFLYLQKVDISHHYERIGYTTKHYIRSDESDATYENYYMEEKIVEDFPRNQLHLYKRYVRQLEQKIKQLEQQLQEK
jgi:hypothetical protein